jgi:hypothetical protein
MLTVLPRAEIVQVTTAGAFGLCVLLTACGPVQAQPENRRPASSAQMHIPSTQNQREVRIPGTDLPSAAEPACPPSSLGRPSSGTSPSGGRAQMNDGPSMPGGPTQAPLGGAEWLAAAGAAYALNRLRTEGSEEDDDEEA